MSAEIADELRAKLRDEWLRKATSSFTCQECGIQANFIDEIINALDAKEAGGWQPIETAPKDGKEFLAAFGCGDGDTPPPLVLAWNPEGLCWVAVGLEVEVFTVPTHWQPLPAPPSRLLNKEDRNG